MKKILTAGSILVIAACTTSDKGSTPADTATAAPTAIAPANTSAPAVTPSSTPVESSAVPAAPAKSTTPKTTTGDKTPVPTERDSAFRPRGTVDANGNITPIKRDSLK